MGVGYPEIEAWLTLPTSGDVEITNYIRTGGAADVVLTGGRDDWRNQAGPSTCRLMVDNRDGRFSPTNVYGAWYGQIKRGVPLTIKAKKTSPANPVRFAGQIVELPVRWDQSGNDRYVTLSAAGITRRLARGASESALRRALLTMGSAGSGYPFAYWPCEGGATAGALGSAVGGPPLAARGTITYGSSTAFDGSAALPVLGSGGGFDGLVGNYTAVSNRHVTRVALVGPTGGYGATRNVVEVLTTGTVKRWYIQATNASLATWQLLGYDSSGALVVSPAAYGTGQLWDRPIVLEFTLTQNGADIDYRVDDYVYGASFGITGTLAANTIGKVNQIRIGSDGAIAGTTIGHVHFSSDPYTSTRWDAAQLSGRGNVSSNPLLGERADARITRLCSAISPAITVTCPQINSSYTGELMGKQPIGTLLAVLKDAADTDGGHLADSMVGLGLEYYSRRYLYTAATALTLDTSSGHLAAPPEPTLDDQGIVSDATVARTGGTASRYDVTHPEGLFTASSTLNVYTDGLTLPAAEWLVYHGTSTALRIPRLRIDLRRNPSLIPAWFLTRFGQRLRVTNPPVDAGPGPLDYVIQGWSERLGYTGWDVEFNLTPAEPWNIAVAGDNRRLDTSGSTVSGTYTTTATAITVATTSSFGRPWTTAVTMFPFDVVAGTGEVMTVTSISGATSPQTFTVTRSTNGVVKTLPNGTSINVANPIRAGR